MLPRSSLAAALAAVCFLGASSAIPLTVNHTQLTLPTSSPQLGPYFANYSLVGQEVECSDAAKRCLAINRLLHEPSGICYELGDRSPCVSNGSALVLDAESFIRGQLHSKCSESDSCRGFNMAYDGKCYGVFDVLRTLCNGTEGVMTYPFGGGLECKIPKSTHETVKLVRQPNSSGRCIVPNLQNNDVGPFWVECSTAEEECLRDGLLPYRGICHEPLSKLPCPEDQWLVLDEGAAQTGLLSAKCVSSHPCGFDAKLLRAYRSCHENTELSEKLCNGNFILPVPTGEYICSHMDLQYKLYGLRNDNGLCNVKVFPFLPVLGGIHFSVGVGGLVCGMNDKNVCQPEVQPPNSKPDIPPVE